MSFQQGLSGLNASSKQLETIGNNIANSNTVGFKSSVTQFSDVYANSLSGTSGQGTAGIGTRVSQVAQQFSQGNITASNSALDMAINGGGFFRLSNNGSISYARNGQFQVDNSGFIVSANGARLTGFGVNSQGVITRGTPQPLQISTADLPPKQTSEIDAQLNLDSRAAIIDPTVTAFNPSNPATYTNATSVTAFDSLGNSHVVQTYYVKTAQNSWNVFAASDNAPVNFTAGVAASNAGPTVTGGGAPSSFAAISAGTFSINGVSIGAVAAGTDAITQGANVAAAINSAAVPGVTAAASGTGVVTLTVASPATAAAISINGSALDSATAATNKTSLLNRTGFTTAQVGTQAVQSPVGTLNFKSDGSINTATTTLPLTATIPLTNGATTPMTVNIDYTGTTQFGSTFGVNSLVQDGFASGRLSGFNTGSDGTVTGRYTNGKTATLGQVVLANFRNPNGMQPLGSNQWAETAASGNALVGEPNSGSLGTIQSSATEDSNVDLTAELVNMITAQRVFQANAQTIKTQDQVLQTLVNLR